MGVRYARDSAGRRWNSSLSKCMEGDTVEVTVNVSFDSIERSRICKRKKRKVRNSVLNGI